jgi:16S rRNA (adenine1518-N6/adenine1519-N6)-dimethyltransferase
VADRLAAACGSAAYGPLSVLTVLLGRITMGPIVPPGAFWPRPKVSSRMVRIDFDAQRAGELADAEALRAAVGLAFGQRRKQIGAIVRRKSAGFGAEAIAAALAAAGIAPTCRAEQVSPAQYLASANSLAGQPRLPEDGTSSTLG